MFQKAITKNYYEKEQQGKNSSKLWGFYVFNGYIKG